jgi:uncharacterized protein
MTSLLVSAFLLGLASNFHCIGMCGPLALVLPIDRSSKKNMLWGIFTYNFGRILTYTILGFVVGSLGLGLQLLVSVQMVSIIFGSLMILFAWRHLLEMDSLFSKMDRKLNAHYFRFFQSLRSKSGSFPAFLFGLVNGLLPCGMVYFALLNAITAENMQGAGLAMLFFGLGTLPVMFFLTYLMQNVNKRFQSNLNRWLPYILTIAALLTILRGMNLGIPYLSPKVTIEQHELRKQPSLECCETTVNEQKN